MAIRTWACRETQRLFQRERSRVVPSQVVRRAYRKLLILDACIDIQDLRVPPGNRLERLTGDRSGQHSIRVNDQYRICFVWRGGDAYQVEIVDYHT